MNRFLILAAGLALTGTASANHPYAPPPMGSGPVAGVVDGSAGGCSTCGGGVAGPVGDAGFAAPVGGGAGFAHHDARFGWNPLFRRLAFWKRDNSCGTCGDRAGLFGRLRGLSPFAGAGGCNGGCGAGGMGGAGGWGAGPAGGLFGRGGHGGPAFNPYPNGVPGTLVFPNHHYTRSPRDFFMTDSR